MEDTKKIGWGVISTANIARKVVRAIASASNAEVVAVSSRTLSKAEAFAQDLSISKAYGDHTLLLEDPNVDAVYVPLPTAVRKQWVLAAAAAKKHVLCEKPCALSLADLEDMVEACRANKVQFMDGVMFEHHSRLAAVKKTVGSADFGQLQTVVSHFSFPGAVDEAFCNTNIRMNPMMEPFGSLGDLGWYNIRLCLDLFSVNDAHPAQTPVQVMCCFHEVGEGGLPVTTSGVLSFSGGGSAVFNCSFAQCFDQRASILSDRMSVNMDDFVLALNEANVKFTQIKGTQTEDWTRHYLAADHHVLNCCQERAMIEKFSKLAESLSMGVSDVEDPEHCHWPRLSLATQAVLDAAAKSASNGGKSVDIAVSGVYEYYLNLLTCCSSLHSSSSLTCCHQLYFPYLNAIGCLSPLLGTPVETQHHLNISVTKQAPEV